MAGSRGLHDTDSSDFEPPRYLLDLILAEQEDRLRPQLRTTSTLPISEDTVYPIVTVTSTALKAITVGNGLIAIAITPYGPAADLSCDLGVSRAVLLPSTLYAA